jgi:nucleotide-binding universal stress UspA family protein
LILQNIQRLLWIKLDAEKALLRQVKNKLSQVRSRFPNYRIKQAQGEPASEILRAQKEYDLIIMAPHNRRPMFPAFGRVTIRVLRRTHKPILVIP